MKQSSLTTGVVQGMILTSQQDGGEVTAVVGSTTWFMWLEHYFPAGLEVLDASKTVST